MASDNSKRQELLAEYGECICVPDSCDDDLHGDGFCPPCAHMDPYWSCFNDEDDPWPPVDKAGESDA